MSDSILFKLKYYFFIYTNIFLCDRMKNIGFFCSFFFELLLKFSDFVNSDVCIGKITSKFIEYIQFSLKKYLKFIKIRFILVKKLKIQVIISMIIIIRSSERIFNPINYAGIKERNNVWILNYLGNFFIIFINDFTQLSIVMSSLDILKHFLSILD